MKVGTICFATNSGLGILAKSFYDHGIVTDALVVKHRHHPCHSLTWYPDSVVISHSPFAIETAKRFCSTVDVMLFFETPFDWHLIDHCRKVGVPSVIMPMHECMPRTVPVQPDAYIAPSELDHDWAVKQHSTTGVVRICRLNVPVEVAWRQRTKAEVFVHNAGHGGLKGRNGTAEVLEAIKYVKSPAKFYIRGQCSIPECSVSKVTEYVSNFTLPYPLLYRDGDVFVFPEKFNGLSLPLQEARAAGMLVMATDRYPMNTWLPNVAVDGPNCSLSPLIPVSNTVPNCLSERMQPFNESILDPRAIAAKIDEWYGRDITLYSQTGKEWAEANSWSVLGPKYKEVLESL